MGRRFVMAGLLACLSGGLCVCHGADDGSLLDEFALRRWTNDDGLPERVVQSVTQDADGYLWVATFRHVLRFDGVRFVSCGHLGDDIEVSRAEIAVQVLATRGRRIWLRTTEAIWLRDAAGWRCMLAERPDANLVGGLREVPDGSGDVMATTTGRVVRLGKRGEEASPPAAASPGLPWALFQGQPLEPLGRSLVARPVLNAATPTRVWDLGTWKGTVIGLTTNHVVAWRGDHWDTMAKTPVATGKLLCDPGHDGIWCGGDSGLWLVRNVETAPRWSGLVNGRSPINATVRSLVADDDGNVWVGTDAGLVRLRRRERGVTVVAAEGPQPGINAAWVEPDGQVWAAPDTGGLMHGSVWPVEGKAATFTRVPLDDQVGGLRFEAVQRAEDGSLWLGTDGAYLWKCRGHQPAENISYRGLGRRMAIVMALAARRAGGLWVGSGDGLFMLHPDGTIDAPTDAANQVVPVSTIMRDTDGSLWCATAGAGVVHRDAAGVFQGSLDMADGLPSDVVHAVYRDRRGVLWLGTDAGLVRVVEAGGRLRGESFPLGSGLRSVAIVQIAEDERGRLWLGTRRGILRVEPSLSHETAAFVVRLGAGGPLAEVACRGRVSHSGDDAELRPLVFTSDQGLVLVDPAVDPPAARPPAVHIEEIVLADGTAAARSERTITAAAPDTVVPLPPGASDIDIHFTGLHFAAPEQPVFRYRLTRPQAERQNSAVSWNPVGRDRSVTFRALPAGRHLFEVTAGVDGVWQPQPARVVLDVAPFLWERPVFWLAAAVSGAAAMATTVAGVVRQRYRRQLAREQVVQRERERIARDIHDDLGAGLTQVALLSEIAADDLGNAVEMERHLARIFKASRDLTSALDEIVWAVNPGNDALEKLVSFVGEFTQDFLMSAQVRCRLDLPDEVPALNVGAAVRHHLCMVLKEALNNAVRHSGATEVAVGIRLEGRRLRLTIRDDGSGFEPAAVPADRAGRQSGLADMAKRMAEVRGGVRVVPSPLGTLVMADVEV